MSKKLECEIVQDLLPMYVDQLTSDYTTQRVKEHLEECPPCHEIYDLMTDAEEEQIEHKKEAKKLKRYLKKIKLFHVIIGSILAFGCYIVLTYAYYSSFEGGVKPVKSGLVEVTELYELENGWIFLTLHTTDSYRNGGLNRDLHSNTLYYSLSRYLLPSRAEVADTYDSTTRSLIIDPEKGVEMYYIRGHHILKYPDLTILEYAKTELVKQIGQQREEKLNAIYYQGQDEDDRVLIWERGMELPKLVE